LPVGPRPPLKTAPPQFAASFFASEPSSVLKLARAPTLEPARARVFPLMITVVAQGLAVLQEVPEGGVVAALTIPPRSLVSTLTVLCFGGGGGRGGDASCVSIRVWPGARVIPLAPKFHI